MLMHQLIPLSAVVLDNNNKKNIFFKDRSMKHQLLTYDFLFTLHYRKYMYALLCSDDGSVALCMCRKRKSSLPM